VTVGRSGPRAWPSLSNREAALKVDRAAEEVGEKTTSSGSKKPQLSSDQKHLCARTGDLTMSSADNERPKPAPRS
jgi:hypothetical protein